MKTEKYTGALLFAHHHPPYTLGGQHSSSVEMRQQMDAVCKQVGVWPHAVLAGHAHNYQRYTRLRSDGTEIPYLVCGNGGHNVQKLKVAGRWRVARAANAPAGDRHRRRGHVRELRRYGLRLSAGDRHRGAIAHRISSCERRAVAKTPDDSVTIDLATRKRTSTSRTIWGFPASAKATRALFAAQTSGKAPAKVSKKTKTKKAAKRGR